MKKVEIASKFGVALDNDKFNIAKSVLDAECVYHIGDQKLYGPDEICNSYEQNMIEGRKKLDELIWGKCKVENINSSEFYIHFTDHLVHKGIKHIHHCKQKVLVNDNLKITRIEHIHDVHEQSKLDAYYYKVGLK